MVVQPAQELPVPIQVMIWMKSGMIWKTCCHRSYQSDSLEQYQCLFHWGSSDAY